MFSHSSNIKGHEFARLVFGRLGCRPIFFIAKVLRFLLKSAKHALAVLAAATKVAGASKSASVVGLGHLFLIANIVTTSKALVTTSVAPVTTSVAPVSNLLLF